MLPSHDWVTGKLAHSCVTRHTPPTNISISSWASLKNSWEENPGSHFCLTNSSGPSLRRLLLVLDVACPLPNTYWNQVSSMNCWETEPFRSVGRSGFTFIEGECPCSHVVTFRLESKAAAPFTPSSLSVFCQEQHENLTEASGILDFTDSRTSVHNKPFFPKLFGPSYLVRATEERTTQTYIYHHHHYCYCY